jgi:single-strand DNA-binding protein
MAFNKCIIQGNITSQPELKQTATGTEVCNFSLAVNRKFAKQGEQSVDYINIVAFKHNATYICRYCGKGSSVLVCGQLQTRNYTNSQGQKVYVTEIIADEVQGMGGNSQNNGNQPRVSTPNASGNGYTPSAYGGSSAGFEPIEIPQDDSLPFDFGLGFPTKSR